MRYERITLGEGADVVVTLEGEEDVLEGEIEMIFGTGGTPKVYVVYVYDLTDTVVLGPGDVHHG